MKNQGLYFGLTLCAFVLAYCVVVLGAYVRLSDAGLGCPDWPGCYGKLIVPADASDVAAGMKHASGQLHRGKAWKEMIHRYAAGSLGMLIFILAFLAWRGRHRPGGTLAVPALLAGLVVFQALLGMWTVTLLLKPVVVMGHLIGGFSILALLYWLLMGQLPALWIATPGSKKLLPWVAAGLLVLGLQILLGGWTSSNYAALICPEFPTCRGGEWLPTMNFKEGFTLWRGLGVNYEGGVLDAAARTAIHISHRVGALLTLLVLSAVALRALALPGRPLRAAAAVLALALLLQVTLGISNVLYVLPLPVAVAHNAVAALLLLCLVTLLRFSLHNPD